MLHLQIQVASRLPGVPAPATLRKWLRLCAPAGARLTLRIVNRVEGRKLNGQFRNKDYATNVLTFAYGETPVEADIVLCAPVIAAEAREQGKLLAAHYAHLTIHGVLHACGYDHETTRDAARMEAREVAILGKLGIRNPYLVLAGA